MDCLKIKKGNHRPPIFKRGLYPVFHIAKKWEYNKIIRVPKDSIFIFPNDDKFDFSKFFGVSFGHHQKNESYRFGFRILNDNEIEISIYMYIDGKRIIEPLINIDFDKFYYFQITRLGKELLFSIKDSYENDLIVPVTKKIKNFKIWGYTLGLYIGGNLPAPKDLTFYFI